MTETRKLRIQPPPDGFVWAQDHKSEDGRTVPGIASRLGITYSTYRKWRMRGEGPPTVVLGKKLAARVEWIDQFMAQREREALDAFNTSIADADHAMRPAESRLIRAA